MTALQIHESGRSETSTPRRACDPLTGDCFPPGERGRIYAFILGGEVAGAAAGYIVSGAVASLWIPAGVTIGAAAVLLGHPHTTRNRTSVPTA